MINYYIEFLAKCLQVTIATAKLGTKVALLLKIEGDNMTISCA